MTRAAVWFGPTVASARRAAEMSARRAAEASARRAKKTSARREAPERTGAASPRHIAPLVRALATGEAVVVVDPSRPSAAWERAKRKILLPPAPGLLRDAIGGIAVHEAPARGAERRAAGATRAHWIPGDLTDRRAAAILASPPVPPLWVVEDFRRLRIGAPMQARLDASGIRIAAYRALRVARRGRRGRIAR